MGHQVGRVVAGSFVAVVLAAGCARAEPNVTGSAGSSPATPSHGGLSAPATPSRTGPGYVVTRVSVAVEVDNSVRLDPPAADAEPMVSGSRAFTLARHRYGDPQGTVTPRVALTSYTNNTQGTILADGGTRLFYVHRLAWVVIDYGGICVGTGAPGVSGSPAPTPVASHRCLYLSFIDAHTGRDLGGMSEGGPDNHDISIS